MQDKTRETTNASTRKSNRKGFNRFLRKRLMSVEARASTLNQSSRVTINRMPKTTVSAISLIRTDKGREGHKPEL